MNKINFFYLNFLNFIIKNNQISSYHASMNLQINYYKQRSIKDCNCNIWNLHVLLVWDINANDNAATSLNLHAKKWIKRNAYYLMKLNSRTTYKRKTSSIAAGISLFFFFVHTIWLPIRSLYFLITRSWYKI